MNFSQLIFKKAIYLSKLILSMTTTAASGHPSSSLSLVHIVTVLMYKLMRYDPKDPWNPANDRLVLSEGHAVPVIYAAYADLNGAYGSSPDHKKFLSVEDLDTLRQITSPLDGHPNPSSGFPFFDCATGSLGQGLSCACGLALAARLENIKKHIFVLIGDGESREGQIWEACDFLIDYSLSEVIPIFNCNGLAQTGKVSPQQSPEKLAAKLKAFGFIVHTIDGHAPQMIRKYIRLSMRSKVPNAIIALTVKGWGVQELQGENFHGKPLKKNQLEKAYSELDSTLANRPSADVNRISFYPSIPGKISLPSVQINKIPEPDFEKLLENDSHLKTFQSGKLSTRRAYGLALREAGKVDSRIVSLDGDVGNSTFAEYFAKEFPERFFESRIAEQNMISVAAGLAKRGKIPFVSSFSKFLIRGYDQLELAIIAGANIKLCGSHSGANIAADGPSQMGLTDLAYMRSLSTVENDTGNPAMIIFNPACAVAAYKLVQLMIDIKGAVYLRTIRQDLPLIYDKSETFDLYGAKLVCKGSDISIMASGYMVHACTKVINDLCDAGISASLYDCYCLPLNPSIVAQAAMNNERIIISVEDNYGNGLGSEIASIITREPGIDVKLKQLFVSRIPKSGLTAQDVLDYTGLGV